MSEAAKFSDFFKYADFFYATLGVKPYQEPGAPKGKSWLSYLILIAESVNLNCMLICEIIFVAMAIKNGNHFLESTMVMSYVGFVVMGNVKLFLVWMQEKSLTKFINGLREIFPETRELQLKYDLPKYLGQCSRLTVSFALLYMILIWTYNLVGIVQHLFFGVEQTLPYLMYIPWNWHNNWSYYVLYILEDIAGYTSAAEQIASDLLLVACATQLIMHFDYIAFTISHYQCKEGERGLTKEEAQKEDMRFLRNITEYHANLLDLSELVNEVFGLPLLLNFITSSFVICFVGFQITMGATPETIVKLILFLVSSATQVYLICHYSQQLIDMSTNVANAVYNQNWSLGDIYFQRMMVLIAKRAQKPVQLKATTFVLISQVTMTEIMQMSYKFFALLKTMYSN